MITINIDSSVVEYTFTREIIFALGFGAIREKDELVVYKNRTSYSLYTKITDNEKVWALSIGEGYFSACLCKDGLKGSNAPWMEMVDFRQLLGLIVKRYSPEFKPRPSEFIGRGRTQQHFIDEYWTEIMRMQDENPDSEMFETFRFISGANV